MTKQQMLDIAEALIKKAEELTHGPAKSDTDLIVKLGAATALKEASVVFTDLFKRS